MLASDHPKSAQTSNSWDEPLSLSLNGLRLSTSSSHLQIPLTGVSNLWSVGRVRPRMTLNVAQHKIVNLVKILWFFLWLCVAIYLMCGPGPLFFLCGPEKPKCWTPLLELMPTGPRQNTGGGWPSSVLLEKPRTCAPSGQLQTVLEHHPTTSTNHGVRWLLARGHSQFYQLSGLGKSLPLTCWQQARLTYKRRECSAHTKGATRVHSLGNGEACHRILQDTYCIRPCYQDTESKQHHLIYRNKHREAAKQGDKEIWPKWKNINTPVKERNNRDKQSIRCRVQNTGCKDAQGTWYFNSIKKTQAEMKDMLTEIKNNL